MKPFIHAKNSANKFGGKPEDYQAIHDFMDSSKAVVPDMRHRAIFHSAFGCFIVEKVFGTTIVNSDGEEVSTRDIAEEHILEDLGRIPTLQDWLSEMNFQEWMMSPELRINYQDPNKNPCVEIKLEGSDINEKERSQIKTTEQVKFDPNIAGPTDFILDGGPRRNELLDSIANEVKKEASKNVYEPRKNDVKSDDEIKEDAFKKNIIKDGKRVQTEFYKRILDGRIRQRPLPNDDTNGHVGRGDGKSTFD